MMMMKMILGEVDEFESNDKGVEDEDASEAEQLAKDLHVIAGVSAELMMRDYSTSKTKLDENGPFAIVVDSTGIEKVVRKSSIWFSRLLSYDKYKFSNDRLQRVMEKDYQNSGKFII